MHYVGLGPRVPPAPVFQAMRDLARVLATKGYTLRSGGDKGADIAFELGAADVYGELEVYLPWSKFNGRPHQAVSLSKRAFDLAEALRHNWQELPQPSRSLCARTVHQLLGARLDKPVDFVVCWTKANVESGCECNLAQSTALALAQKLGIPVYDLSSPFAVEQLRAKVEVDSYSCEDQLALF